MNSGEGRHVVQLGGRLGNLLFEVAFGLALEARTAYPWAVTGDLNLETKRTLEAWTGPLPEAAPEEIDALTRGAGVFGKMHRVLQRFLPPSLRTWILQDSPLFVPRHLRVRRPAFWSGYWQSPRYFLGQEPAVRSGLRYRGTLPPTLRGLESLAESPDSVSIHVRRGDYLSTPGFDTLEPAFYLRALDVLAAEGPVLVFSDDPAWCREELRLGRTFTVVEGGRPEDDLYLMSLCQHHVIAQSTFSWWGAWLGVRARGRVVAPATWFPSFGRIPPADHIYPPHWERAGNT